MKLSTAPKRISRDELDATTSNSAGVAQIEKKLLGQQKVSCVKKLLHKQFDFYGNKMRERIRKSSVDKIGYIGNTPQLNDKSS